MADCDKCLKSLRNVRAKVACVDCANSFHAKCVNMSAEDDSYLTEQGDVWRCEPCSQKRRKVNRDEGYRQQTERGDSGLDEGC